MKLFRSEVLAERGRRLVGDMMLTEPIAIRICVIVVMMIVVLILGYFATFQYARKETVQGWLVPDKGIAKIYPARSGYLAALHVKDGDDVAVNAPVATIISSTALASGTGVDVAITESLAAQIRLVEQRLAEEQALETNERERFAAQLRGITSELAALQRRIALQKERIEVAEAANARLDQLLAKGLVSENERQVSHAEAIDMKKALSELEQAVTAKRSEQTGLNAAILRLPIDSSQRHLELERQLSELKQKSLESEARGSYMLVAPVTGSMTSIAARVGEAVTTTTPIATVIPEGAQLEARLLVPTRAIGMMRQGLRVIIRYDAFPYQRYGVYRGTVSSIARSILTPDEVLSPIVSKEPVYLVTVRLDSQVITTPAGLIPLQPGMTLSASVVLEVHSLLAWAIAPFRSLQGFSG